MQSIIQVIYRSEFNDLNDRLNGERELMRERESVLDDAATRIYWE